MMNRSNRLRSHCELEKVEVIENQEHGQKNIDNHSGQHYNVEQFRVISHSFDLINKSDR